MQNHFRARLAAYSLLDAEDEQELTQFNLLSQEFAQKIKAMGFEVNPEPASRGHKNNHAYIKRFPNGVSLLITLSSRTFVQLLGMQTLPYSIKAREVSGVRILDKWYSEPTSIRGYKRSLNELLRDLPSWIQRISTTQS